MIVIQCPACGQDVNVAADEHGEDSWSYEAGDFDFGATGHIYVDGTIVHECFAPTGE